jgi:DNA-binding beta-propeller fold protein YncE
MSNQSANRFLKFAVALCCALAFVGCGKPEPHHYALDNGKAIEVLRHRDGRVRVIKLLDEAANKVLIVAVEYDGEGTRRVLVFDASDKVIGETVFSSGNTSFIAGPILNELRTESDGSGVTVKRVWTYDLKYVVYAEEFKTRHDGSLISKVIRGPYGFLLEEYYSGEQQNSTGKP